MVSAETGCTASAKPAVRLVTTKPRRDNSVIGVKLLNCDRDTSSMATHSQRLLSSAQHSGGSCQLSAVSSQLSALSSQLSALSSQLSNVAGGSKLTADS